MGAYAHVLYKLQFSFLYKTYLCQVQFANPVNILAVHVYETNCPGALSAIDCVKDGTQVSLWSTGEVVKLNETRIHTPTLVRAGVWNVFFMVIMFLIVDH